MNYFSLCLNGLCLTGQSVMHIFFVSRLTRKKQKVWRFAAYFFLFCIMEWFFNRMGVMGYWLSVRSCWFYTA